MGLFGKGYKAGKVYDMSDALKIIEGNDGRQKSLQDRREFPQVNPERVGK